MTTLGPLSTKKISLSIHDRRDNEPLYNEIISVVIIELEFTADIVMINTYVSPWAVDFNPNKKS